MITHKNAIAMLSGLVYLVQEVSYNLILLVNLVCQALSFYFVFYELGKTLHIPSGVFCRAMYRNAFLHLRFLWRRGDRGLRHDSCCCF